MTANDNTIVIIKSKWIFCDPKREIKDDNKGNYKRIRTKKSEELG